jgi:8-amino-7-oxononanoate synthase
MWLQRYSAAASNESARNLQSLDSFANGKLVHLEQTNLKRNFAETWREDGINVRREGRRLVSFSCNDYLNLSHHPRVKAAAIAAIELYGTGAGASRLVTGNHPLFAELEQRLATLKGSEAACIFGSGYLTNLGIIPALAGKGDLILVDELAHACIFSGTRLSSAETVTFRHNDCNHVRQVLTARRSDFRHVLVATDGVFSMDGDLAPVAELAEICQSFNAWLMTDDAHGLGTIAQGRGSSVTGGHKAEVPLQMGTLSKALGSYGGYICASRPVIDLLKTRARTLLFATGLPPANVAAALAAVDFIEREPDYVAQPLVKARTFTTALGLKPAQSPIVPLVLGEAQTALEASRMLEDEGFLVVAIRPPTVAAGTARLRFAFSAGHKDEDIARLAAIIAERLSYRQYHA